MGTAVYFALKDAITAARTEHLPDEGDNGMARRHFALHSPATSEKIRMACADKFALRALAATSGKAEGEAAIAAFEARGSY